MQRNEHRKNPRGIADLLLPYALIDDGVLLQQDGSLMTAWSFRGPDMMSASASEMSSLSRAYSSSRTAEQILERFRSRVAMFENVFGSLFQTERLKRVTFADDFGDSHTHDQLLRYIRRCVTGLDHPFALPEFPVFLNELLAGEDFVAGVE